jgi:rhodanese-related sulfurtransferase
MNKNRFFEILVIVAFSVVIAFVYNYTTTKPLPLIYHKKIVPKLDDSQLFGNGNSNNLDSNKLISDKTVTFEQMNKVIESNTGEFIIVDARNSDYWKKSKIGNSINIFPYEDESIVINKILDLPHDKKIIVYCDGGNCDSSHKIAEMMKNFGLENVFIYTGGWEEWTKMKGIKE